MYIFQLDRKRQLDSKLYSMQYTTGYMDEEGFAHNDTTQLLLQAKQFQSFYVPDGHELLDLVLIGDENKLRINKSRLHSGIDLEDRFMRMKLSSTFDLDRHQDREFINFNWLGSGLFEKYDTLYISLFDNRGLPVSSVTMNVEQVDINAEPTGNRTVRYIGYDSKNNIHKVLTMGKPAYIEILAKGFLPIVYKYAGAADEETGFVSEDRCMATITLKKGRYNDDEGIVVSESAFLNLNDEKEIVIRNKVDHELCTIDEIDLSANAAVDTVAYFEDCGMDYPKLLDNKAIDRFARIQASFSRPKGGSAPDCFLYATDVDSKVVTEATDKDVYVISANKYTSFTRDYYDVRFSLLDVIPTNTVAHLQMVAGDMTYDEFPHFFNMKANREEQQEEIANQVETTQTGTSKEDEEKISDSFSTSGFDVKLPVQFRLNIKPVMVTSSIQFDFRKKIFSGYVSVSLQREMEQQEGETEEMSDARRELRAKEMYESEYRVSEDGSMMGSVLGDKVMLQDKEDDFKSWVYRQSDDIFDFQANRVGTGWFGGAKFEMKCNASNKQNNWQISNAAGGFGYGLGLSTTDLGGATGALLKTLNKIGKYVGIKVCGFFDISAQVDLGIKTFDKAVMQNWSALNEGYFFRLGAKAKIAATATISTPQKYNNVFNVQAGLRVGGKVGVQFGLEGPFANITPGVGVELAAVCVGEAFYDLRTLLLHWSGRAGFAIGAQGLLPDNDHNPFHSKFPYWLPKGPKPETIGKAYQPLRNPIASNFGKVLVNDVAIDANPHFLDGGHEIYNDLRNPNDYNDDQVSLVTLADTLATEQLPAESLSATGTSATNHMRSKRGDHEIVAYEQMNAAIGEIDEEHVEAFNSEVMKLTRIRASINNGSGWQQTMVSDADMPADYADLKPVVTMQDDGHAACIYRHGKITYTEPTGGSEASETSEEPMANTDFTGQLMLKTFDGTRWSKATPLFDINANQGMNQYDLIMRNDTVLVAASYYQEGQEKPVMRYASKTIGEDRVSYVNEALTPVEFFMNRVGQNGVIAILYEVNDSTRDIYVKTLDMNGLSDGRAGADLGVRSCTPSKVKIVCDRQATKLADFALLWTETNNTAYDDDGTMLDSEWTGMKLNASRIHLTNAPQITAPITVGSEVDSVLVMTDFDGFLDDAHISAVYTLGNVETGAAVIMHCDRYFHNSFDYDVSYARQSLLGSSTLPINVEVRNTGTSAIQSVHVNINGQNFDVENGTVAPRRAKTFVVQYPISDDFDGYISSSVSVDYNNVFSARRHPRHLAKSYVGETKQKPTHHIVYEQIEARLVSRYIEEGLNTFVVELIDHGNLHDDIGIHVGIYAKPSVTDPVADAAEVVMRSTDFVEVAGQRKAWAVVSIGGIAEPTTAYIDCHLFDLFRTDQNGDEVVVKNTFIGGSAHCVQLFPTDDPEVLTRILSAQTTAKHNVTITQRDGGVTLSGLTEGETVRVFSLDGRTVCRKEATASTLFVPLRQQGTYVLSAGQEVFKFQY